MTRLAVFTTLLATSVCAEAQELLICSTSPIFTPDFVSQSYSSVMPQGLRPVVFNVASAEDLYDEDEDLIFVFLDHSQPSASLDCFGNRTDDVVALEPATIEASSAFDEPTVVYGIDATLGPPDFLMRRHQDGEDDIVFVLWRWGPEEAAEVFLVSLQIGGGFQEAIEGFLYEVHH